MPAPHGPNIVIDKQHYQAPKSDMSGAELKELASIAADFRIFKIHPGPSPDEPVGDAEMIHLDNGDHFYSLPPGRVGDLIPSVQAEIDEVVSALANSIIHAGDGSRFLIEVPLVPLPEGHGWDQKTTRILIPVPASYPTSRPPTSTWTRT